MDQQKRELNQKSLPWFSDYYAHYIIKRMSWMNWWQERERKGGKDCHSQGYIHVVPASRYMRCSTYFVLLLFLCFAGFSQLVGQRQRVETGEEADAWGGKRKEKSLFTLLRSVFRFCRQELSPLSKPIRCAEIFSLVAGGWAGNGGRGVIKRERERRGEISREIHLLTRKERRLIHWRCSRDPPRMQTQSLQRVTREMIDEGIGEKVAQRGKKKKKHREKKEEREKKGQVKGKSFKSIKAQFLRA